jgi:hypothetical protein
MSRVLVSGFESARVSHFQFPARDYVYGMFSFRNGTRVDLFLEISILRQSLPGKRRGVEGIWKEQPICLTAVNYLNQLRFYLQVGQGLADDIGALKQRRQS